METSRVTYSHTMVSDNRKPKLDVELSYCQNNINMPACQSITTLARPILSARSYGCASSPLQPVIFAAHGVDPVDALESANCEMTAGYILEVLDKGEIDGGTA